MQTYPVLCSQIFGLEYADGVGGLHDLVIQTFVRFTAKSCEAIIISTTVLYLLVRKNYKLLIVYMLYHFRRFRTHRTMCGCGSN